MLLNFGVGEDSWESLGLKEIQPVNPKGNQSWIFTRRTDAEASILWSPDTKSWLIGKDPDDGKDWRQEEKGVTEDEMVGWHHWLDGHEFEPTLGDSEGQGGLVCCSPWGHKESDTTERLNNSMIYKSNADKYQKTDNAEPWAVGGRKLTCSEVWYREGGMAGYDGLLSWRKQFRKAEARRVLERKVLCRERTPAIRVKVLLSLCRVLDCMWGEWTPRKLCKEWPESCSLRNAQNIHKAGRHLHLSSQNRNIGNIQ